MWRGIMRVDPQLARHWLRADFRRLYVEADVAGQEALIAAMKSGAYDSNRSQHPIVIDSDERILDGRHRTSAVIVSGVTCRIYVVIAAD